MFLKQLNLQHYRNYESLQMNTDHQVNIFLGPNAQGKTNLLESIFVLALTKSHRTHKDRELIHWNEKFARLDATIAKKYGDYSLDLTISNQGKKAKINGLEQRKLSDYIGTLNVVLFAPEDLEIVKGSPSVRRRFMDMEIGQIHPSYIYDLTQYSKILTQRNHLLKQQSKQTSEKQAMLSIWNEQLAQFGVKIMLKRQSFIKRLQTWAEQIHASITKQSEKLQILYEPSLEIEEEIDETVLFEKFMLKLAHVEDQELRRGVSLVGPHRDDLQFYINDKQVFMYGSQGQQRTTALSIKLAEIELIHEEVGEYPLLLLDDVLSELDRFRQTQLIETFQSKVQTFITTTSIDSIHLDVLGDVNIYEIERGSIIRG